MVELSPNDPKFVGCHKLFPNEIILNVKIPNVKIRNQTINQHNNPECKNPKNGNGTKLGEGKGTKLGEHCSKVRLSQDRMLILKPKGKGTNLGEGERD